jgi:hypothetical protein
MLFVRQKVTAGGAAFAGRNHVLVRAVGVHDENLIAAELVARGLKDDLLAIRRPVRFRVFATEGQLLDPAQMSWRLRRQPGRDQNE